MNELIKIEERDGKRTANARELYVFLGVKERFSKWFNRMIDYGFSEGLDYTPYLMVHPQNKQEITEYFITLDMAKELSMLARSDEGRKARQYFIECEKQLLENSRKENQVTLPSNYIEALEALVVSEKKKEALQIENNQMKPKVQFYDDVTGSKDAIEMKDVAKIINCDYGRNQLFEYLRKRKILMYDNSPYQKFIDGGWFRVVESKYTDRFSGDIRISIKTLVYQKGIDGIIRCLRKDGRM